MAYWYRHPNSSNQKKGKYTILYTDIFQIKKNHSGNIEHQPVCTKSMQLK